MAEPKSMKIINTCKVVPDDSPSNFTLPLTFLDIVWLQIKPSSRLFFYEFPEPNTDFNHTILPKLIHSLSLALKHYLLLAGNLIWAEDSEFPVIQYNVGDGVSFTIAETQADFYYLSGDAFREAAELHSLMPNIVSSETIVPALTLQITVFPAQGFSIGYKAPHAIMDGKSASMFMYSWAYICKKGDVSGLTLELTPCFDRTFTQQHKELEKVFPKWIGPRDPLSKKIPTFSTTTPTMMFGTFRLTRENIEALKNEVKSNHTRVSTFTVTSAYVGICLTRAKNVTADTTNIGFSVDTRLRLDPPLPSTYFGNCVVASWRERHTKDLLADDGFITAVDAVTEALVGLNDGVIKVVERVRRDFAASAAKGSMGFGLGGSPRFELYKVDFGWGKPVKVEMLSTDSGRAFSLADDREDKGGIQIGIALEKHEAEAFASVFAKGLEAR